MNLKTCKKIASLAVNVGASLQKGQDALILISTRQTQLAECIVKECYKKGARKVDVEFYNEDINKLHYKYQKLNTLKTVEDWEIQKAKRRSELLPVRIFVDDENPDAYSSLDMNKIAEATISKSKAIKVYRDIEFLYDQWTIIAVPSPAWAKKVFPNETKANAEKKLLDAILKTTRLDNDDPVTAWDKHIAYLKDKADKLNKMNLDYLVYHSNNGTDLKLCLQPNHKWLSARSKSLNNIEYCANLPTEEVFTMPRRDGVDGVVVATKPLSYNGKIIEDFKVYFEHGRIVKTEARVNGDVLAKAIDTDEGSHYLGEVALVPFDSPINQTGILFLNTLFDENACCHLAFGQAFEDNIIGYEDKSKEELIALGFNESVIHVDFMIGSEDLSIIGYDKEGKMYQIFKDGVWAI